MTACAPPGHMQRIAPCVVESEGTLGISTTLLEMAPGESLQMDEPVFFTAPYLPPDTLAANCVVRWSATGGAAITDAGLLTIARDARPGATVIVRAQVDTLVAEQTVHVIDPAPNPIAATWTQSVPPVCANGERPADAVVRELVFNRGGTFAVTQWPFESRRDYWGTYSYDNVIGRLTLRVESGNSLPGFRTTELVARVAGDELRLDGVALMGAQSAAGAPGCRAVFKRLGGPR